MKKVLYATTALVALGLMPLAGQAQDKKPAEQPISISAGGYFRFHFVGGDQQDAKRDYGRYRSAGNDNAIRDHGFSREGEIQFKGNSKLDNGLVVSVVVELEAETSADQIDETYIGFQHADYGRLLLGSRYGADLSTAKGVVGHQVGWITHFGSNQGDVNPRLNVIGASAGGRLNTFQIMAAESDKAQFDSVRWNGIRLAVDYTPDDKQTVQGGVGESATGLNTRKDGPLSLSQAVTLAADYVETFGPVGVGLSASWQQATAETQSGVFGPTGGTGRQGRGFQGSPTGYRFGAEFTYAGARIGAAWKHIDDNIVAYTPAYGSARGIRGTRNITGLGAAADSTAFYNGTGIDIIQGDREDVTVGFDYTWGPHTIGAHYGYVTQEVPFISRESTVSGDGTKQNTDRLDQIGINGITTFAPGMQLYYGWSFQKFSGVKGENASVPSRYASGNSADNTANIFFVGTQLTF